MNIYNKKPRLKGACIGQKRNLCILLGFLLSGAGALVFTSAAVSAVLQTGTAEPEIEVVTITRFKTDASKIVGSISQVSSAEIKRVGHSHVQELLLRMPGVNIHRGSGQEYLPAIRSPVLSGAGACGGILMAEDGIPLRAAGFCNVNELFEAHTEQAQRIEVIRGPGTALYGSNAMHGVVNVITSGPEDYRSSVTVDAGPNDFGRLKLSTGYRADNWGLNARLTSTHDGGFRHDSGYDQQKLTLHHQYAAGRFNIDSGFGYSNLNQETAGYINGRDAYKSRGAAESNVNPEAFRDARALRLWSRIVYAVDGGSKLQVTPYLRYTDMDFRQHFLPGKPLEQNGQKSFGIQTAYYLQATQELVAIFGIDAEASQGFLKQDQDAPTKGSPFLQATIPVGNHYDYEVDAYSIAPFVHVNWDISEKLWLTAGIRYDSMDYQYDNRVLTGRTRDDGSTCGRGGCRYSRPGDRKDNYANWSPKLGLGYQFAPRQLVYLNLARGFRSPQATELYRLQRDQEVADLDSEHLDSIEVGLKGGDHKLSYQLALFYMHKSNFIFRDSDFFTVSDGQTKHKGVELQLQYHLTQTLDFALNANLVRHEYNYDRVLNGVNIHGNDVDTAPRYFGSARLTWQPLPRSRVELEWVDVGSYYLDPENLHEYPGHDLVNLRVHWSLRPQIDVAARLNNLTDKKYAERADFTRFSQERYFPGMPRSLQISIQWHWL